MSILKSLNYNRYFLAFLSILLLLSISVIPWIEFINNNIDELDFIFNDNLYILVNLYFFIVLLLYFSLKYFYKKESIYLVLTIGISIWILFQHHFLRNEILKILKDSSFKELSSELALFFIVILIVLFALTLKNKKIVRFFVLFFLVFNFIYSSSSLFLKINKLHNKINKANSNISKEIKVSSKTIGNPNIYFFIIDAMMPLNEFENFYKIDLKDFKKFYEKNDFTYYKNTQNLYEDTADILTSIFFLEEIYLPNLDNNKQLKPNIFGTFPTILKDQYSPKLITELRQLNYNFKWIGNIFADCSKYNYKYCLSNKKENYIDFYLLQAFLKKTPIIQIFNKFTEFEIVRKIFFINDGMDAINKFDNFIKSKKIYINDESSTFFFIHDLQTHYPYISDSNCNYKYYPGKTNFEGYKNAYLCVNKKISKIIKTISEFDSDAILIFQSDHNWEMSLNSEEKYGERKNIFNLVKINNHCKEPLPENPNSFVILDYILNCLKNKQSY